MATHTELPIYKAAYDLLDVVTNFVKHQIGCKHYIRYVDDFLLLHESPQWLNEARDHIERFIEMALAARLNPKKTILQPLARGVDFVGQVIKPWRRQLRRRTFNEALQRVQRIDAEDLFQTANSYFGLMRQTDHSHGDRARLANVLRNRGHSIKADLTKTYRRAA